MQTPGSVEPHLNIWLFITNKILTISRQFSKTFVALFKILYTIQIFLEPMGSVAPKVDTRDEFTYARVRLDQDKALICPAQSYPVPVFRWDKKIKEQTYTFSQIIDQPHAKEVEFPFTLKLLYVYNIHNFEKFWYFAYFFFI